MRAAFYCRIGGQGYGFLLPEEADKLREFFAEYQDKPALEKPSSASKIFCRELDIRVTQIVETDMPETLMTEKLAEIRRHTVSAFRAAIGLCNYQVVVIVGFAG